MASVMDVWQTLRTAMVNATTGLTPAVSVFIDTPPADAVGNVSRGGNSLLSIFDLNVARNTTRWPILNLLQVQNVCGTKSALSNTQLNPLSTVTLTITGTPNVGDGLSLVARNVLNTDSEIVFAVSGDTADTMASKLANAINIDPNIGAWIQASVSGNVITLTNQLSATLQLYSATANGGTLTQEVMRIERAVQLTIMTNSYANRQNVVNAVLPYIGLMQAQANPIAQAANRLPDQSWMRVKYNSDKPDSNNHQANIFNWFIWLDVEFGVTNIDLLYPVLAIIPTYDITS